jgi:hypothetical protein
MKAAFSCDWVECFCALDLVDSAWISLSKWTADRFCAKRRPYGTRVYEYIYDVTMDSLPFMTITARPLSRRSLGGIMRDDMCHVKLDNYWLYRDDWYQLFIHALRIFRINPIKLSRLDICCDWQFGECGLSAADLLAGLMKRRYLKVHQPNWRANGTDASKLSWHSLAFGSKSSPVFTRFYNKSLELQSTGKLYIIDTWKLAGLDTAREVYRCEFQLTDIGKEIIDPDTGEAFDIQLEEIADRSRVADYFLRYAKHYFDIRKANTATKRTECKPVRIFPSNCDRFIVPQRPRYEKSSKTDKLVVRRMIESMFMIDDVEARRHMLISIGNYVKSTRSHALCHGAFRLLLDSLRSNEINVSMLIDECFELTRESRMKYDSKGIWLYEIWNDCIDEGWLSQLEVEPTANIIEEYHLEGSALDPLAGFR